MLVSLVSIHVKPEFVDAFRAATIENARGSLQEPGVARFDFLQDSEDPTRFILIEVFRDEDAPARHRETAHYLTWRETVAEMMAEARSAKRYTSIFPEDADWG